MRLTSRADEHVVNLKRTLMSSCRSLYISHSEPSQQRRCQCDTCWWFQEFKRNPAASHVTADFTFACVSTRVQRMFH